MALTHSPKIVTNGLSFAYDMSNTEKSFRGPPTTNLNSGVAISTYLNTPSDVTSVLTLTGEFYKGAPVYRQILTPITATGVSYLTNRNNPGIGVVTNGGGGLAGRYTGHSIFFKPASGRAGLDATSPIFTQYSNIGGWQSSTNYDDMGDEWYRAHVIYYNASGGSDGKYWAINPAGAALNVPITIYWAAPFKEDRNDSTFVSPYVVGTRSAAQAIIDQTGNNTITANSLTYNTDGTFNFNGSTNYVSTTNTGMIHNNGNFSYCCWVNFAGLPGLGTIFENGFYTAGILIRFQSNSIGIYAQYSTTSYTNSFSFTPTLNVWYHLVIARVGDNLLLYSNGVLLSTIPFGSSINVVPSNNLLFIGMSQHAAGQCFNGKIGNVSVYDRDLSAVEVQQNFNALRGRYGV